MKGKGKIRMVMVVMLLFGSIFLLRGQPWVVKGTIGNAEKGQIYLASFYGDRFTILDSLETGTGSFYFMLTEQTSPGVYRIIYNDVKEGIRSENLFIEFVFNRENIDIFTEKGEDGLVPHFPNSVENRVYREFASYEMGYEDRIMELYRELQRPRPGEPVYEASVREYETLQRARTRFIDSMGTAHPGLYATRIIRAFRSPFLPGTMTHRRRIDTLKICFFNHAAIDDPLLLHAPVYSFRLLDYLSLWRNDTLSMKQQQEAYMEAVDRIMVNVSADHALRSFVVEYLLEGFEMLGMEQVQVHLADNYLDEICESDIAEMVQARMEGYREMAEGQKAPDFVIRDIDGENHQLSLLENPYVAVLFWASSCAHCRELLARLHEWYLHENRIGLEFVTISIDTSAAGFDAYIRELEPRWITSHDPLGWEGLVPAAYHIYATPSIFLLDGDRTILGKPFTYRQFLRAVRDLEP
jgi:thiol-disulfide isomerase/thioredoxin